MAQVMDSVEVVIDNRVRLMSALLAATSWPDDEQTRKPHGTHAHARGTRKLLQVYDKHPAVLIMQALLDRGADAKAVDDHGNSLLHQVAMNTNPGAKERLAFALAAGGDPAAANLYLARAIVRRAERAATELAAKEEVTKAALAYINRLSDHLFVTARAIAAAGDGDILWQPGATR